MLFAKYLIQDTVTKDIVAKGFDRFQDAMDVLEAIEIEKRLVPNRLIVRQYRELKVKPTSFTDADLYSPQDS